MNFIDSETKRLHALKNNLEQEKVIPISKQAYIKQNKLKVINVALQELHKKKHKKLLFI